MPAFSSIATLRPDLFLSVLGSIFPDSLGAITCDSLDLWDIQVAGQPVSQILSLLLFGSLLLPYEVPKATIILLSAWFYLASESYYFFWSVSYYHLEFLHVCWFIFVSLTHTRVTWEEGFSIEKLVPSYWPVGMYGHFFWWMIDVDRSSPLWMVPLLGRWL